MSGSTDERSQQQKNHTPATGPITENYTPDLTQRNHQPETSQTHNIPTMPQNDD